MASFNGLKKIAATDIQNSGRFYLGNQVDPGTAGQVIVSAGPNNPVEWGTNSAVLPNALSAGSHITFSSGNPSFDGSIADTINATPGGGLISGNGIDISGATISTDNDGVTINNTGGTGTQNQVLKVPGTLTINQNSSLIDTFDGSTNKTINLVGDYLAGDGIDISGHPVPHIEADTDEVTISHNVGGAEKLQVLKVPNALTAGTNISFSSGTTYDGSSAITISATDTDTQLALVADPGIVITSTGGLNRTIGTRTDGTTIGFSGNDLTTIRVPNALTAGTNISFSSGTTYDGSSAITINASDTDTTYQGGTGISIDTATNPDTINCSNIPNSALQNSTISGKALGTNLANLTFYNSSGTFITSYNGADPPTSITLYGDTQLALTAGPGIDITNTGGLNRTIGLDTNIKQLCVGYKSEPSSGPVNYAFTTTATTLITVSSFTVPQGFTKIKGRIQTGILSGYTSTVIYCRFKFTRLSGSSGPASGYLGNCDRLWMAQLTSYSGGWDRHRNIIESHETTLVAGQSYQVEGQFWRSGGTHYAMYYGPGTSSVSDWPPLVMEILAGR